MSCQYCELLKGKVEKVYEDEDIVAILNPTPSAVGHILILPKEHITILEQVPNHVLAKMLNVANKLSSAVFDTIGAGGTNIFVENGTEAGQIVPHFAVNIIPRREGDNINLQWAPKQVSEEEMSTIELMLKEGCRNIYGSAFDKKPEPVKTKENIEKFEDDRDSYLMKQLDRCP